MISLGAMTWIIVLGVTVYEIFFTGVLAYHWLRYAPGKTAWITLIVYAFIALMLVILLAALAANITL